MVKELNLTTGGIALVDDEDYQRVLSYKWHRHKTGYVRTGIGGRKNHQKIYLHRLILDAPKNQIVDHVNGDPLDNRRENLRLCTHKENIRNMKCDRQSRKSKYKGVRSTSSRKWSAYITVNRKTIYLGTYELEEEAARKYDEAALKYFGEFARVNFQ